jgi:hypothetical protein
MYTHHPIITMTMHRLLHPTAFEPKLWLRDGTQLKDSKCDRTEMHGSTHADACQVEQGELHVIDAETACSEYKQR